MNILDFLAYGWKYSGILFSQKQDAGNKDPKTISYVTRIDTKDWILGAKARRLSRFSKLDASISYVNTFKDHKPADGYFYLHPNIFAKSLQKSPKILQKKNIVMFTHPVLKNNFSIRHRIFVLNKADKVIFLNKEHAKLMTDNGLPKHKVGIMHLASDAKMFLPHERKNGKICCSMAYYERKNPELMHAVIEAMPHRTFVLIGPDWDQYPKAEALFRLPNLEYHAVIDYEKYPEIYKDCDVFFSPSHLEGGPVPLLETMLCNMVPVASKTGYCVDIIKHGENGFLFNSKDSKDVVVPLIEKAFEMDCNTRESVINFTWEKYSEQIDAIFKRQ